jgi:hypothetical protein
MRIGIQENGVNLEFRISPTVFCPSVYDSPMTSKDGNRESYFPAIEKSMASRRSKVKQEKRVQMNLADIAL